MSLNKFTYNYLKKFICFICLLLISGCVSQSIRNPDLLSPHLKSVEKRYERTTKQIEEQLDWRCKFDKLKSSHIGSEIVSSGEFLKAYNILVPFKIANNIYQSGSDRNMKRKRQQLIDRGRKENLFEVNFINATIHPKGINEALIKHQALQKVWIDSAKTKITHLENSDETYRKLAQLDFGWLDTYYHHCTDWRPSKPYINGAENVDEASFPITAEASNILSLQKTLEDKLFTILTAGNSNLPQRLTQFKTVQESIELFATYVTINNGASSRALNRAGIYDQFSKRSELVRQKKQLDDEIKTIDQNISRLSAMIEIDQGKDGWNPIDYKSSGIIAIGKTTAQNDLKFQSVLLCDPNDERKVVIFKAGVYHDKEKAIWNHNDGYGLPVVYKTSDGSGTAVGVINREAPNLAYVNEFYVAFIDPELIKGNQFTRPNDTHLGALAGFIGYLDHLRTAQALRLGVEFLPTSIVEDKKSFTLTVEYVFRGKKRSWVSPDLEPSLGAYKRIKQACFPT